MLHSLGHINITKEDRQAISKWYGTDLPASYDMVVAFFQMAGRELIKDIRSKNGEYGNDALQADQSAD